LAYRRWRGYPRRLVSEVRAIDLRDAGQEAPSFSGQMSACGGSSLAQWSQAVQADQAILLGSSLHFREMIELMRNNIEPNEGG
jgi:hypothetical protein